MKALCDAQCCWVWYICDINIFQSGKFKNSAAWKFHKFTFFNCLLPKKKRKKKKKKILACMTILWIFTNCFVYKISMSQSPGEFSHWHGIALHIYMPAFLGTFFVKFCIAIGWLPSEMEEPKWHKLGIFWANCCKKDPINWVLFYWKWYVYWWVGKLFEKLVRENQIFEVQQAHPHSSLMKVTPLRQLKSFCAW